MKITLFIIMLFVFQCTNSEKDGFYNKPVVKGADDDVRAAINYIKFQDLADAQL